MDKEKILIIPAAAYKENYEEFIPDIFTLNSFGQIKLIHNMCGLPLEQFDEIYITINERIDELYSIKNMLCVQLEHYGNIFNKTRIVIIPQTQNVVETIKETLRHIRSQNYAVFIKDADGYFNITELNNENTVYTYMLEDVMEINPSSKSYVSVTSDDIILNIIEKRIISSQFCAGGYYFDDVKHLQNIFNEIQEYDKLYLSNVIYYDILRYNNIYRAEQVLQFNE